MTSRRYAPAVAAPTPQYVRDLSLTNEFADLTDGQIQNVIDRVVLNYASMTGEDVYLPIAGLHTAHLLVGLLASTPGGGGGKGSLVSVKVGPLEKRYGAVTLPVKTSSGLDESTPYGREALRLFQARGPSIRTTY